MTFQTLEKKNRWKVKWPRCECRRTWSRRILTQKWKNVLWSDSLPFSNSWRKKKGCYIPGVRAQDEVIVTRLSISNSHICDGSGSKGATRVSGTTSAAVTWCWWVFFFVFFLVSSSVLLPSSDTSLWVISCFTSLGPVPRFYCSSSPAAAPECFSALTSVYVPPLSFVFFSFPGVPVF